ncbi:MAG: hypothetical protein AMDU4_FER2C00053G0030 [Ferroplasma sp. Type II]|nr:MAG: hypothetical protein AMDU4_FER2C00053G0030 [Ferroplasma sp. Type II]
MNKNKVYNYIILIVITSFYFESILGIIVSIHGLAKNQPIFKYLLILYVFILIVAIYGTLYLFFKKHKILIKSRK